MLASGRTFTRNIFLEALNRCVAAALLLCLQVGAFSLSRNTTPLSDTVYCPLQRTWVKKTPLEQPAPQQKGLLDQVCASKTDKDDFLTRLSATLRVSRARPTANDAEKLFFTYFAKGRSPASLRILTPGHHAPEVLDSAAAGKSAVNPQLEFAAENARILADGRLLVLSLQGSSVLPRPDLFVSDSVARSANPRAPPFSI